MSNDLLLILFLCFWVSSVGFMFYVIESVKKCLDFVVMFYMIYFFICIVYGGWLVFIMWWVVNIIGLVIMVFLGEYLCIWRELKEILMLRFRVSKRFIYINFFFVFFGYFVYVDFILMYLFI